MKKVVSIKTSIGTLTYLSYRTTNKGKEKTNHELKHQLNIKQALFGNYFTYYNKGMNFIDLDILKDNR